jgi:hypothetical protein
MPQVGSDPTNEISEHGFTNMSDSLLPAIPTYRSIRISCTLPELCSLSIITDFRQFQTILTNCAPNQLQGMKSVYCRLESQIPHGL